MAKKNKIITNKIYDFIKKIVSYFIIAQLFVNNTLAAGLLNNEEIDLKSALNVNETLTKRSKLLWRDNNLNNNTEKGWFDWLYDILTDWIIILFQAFLLFLAAYIVFKIIRLMFELYYSKNLRYLQVTLPRADSKLDKEQATKKDFKEKAAIMSMFYKAIHKLAEAWLKDTFLNSIFGHSKISLELVYNKWQVTFFVITYSNYVGLISQHLTSMYNNAEIIIVDPKKDYVNLKQKWYKIRAASLWKENDDVYPIRTFKYLEDDPLNNFINVFGWLDKKDAAVYQVVIKPEPSSWNKKAMRAASLVAKWKYKKNKKWVLKFLWAPLWILFNPIVALFQWADAMVAWWNNAPWASEWDSYKIFNQAETESQKLMWEAAAQPAFETSIRVLVSSPKYQNCEDWVHAIVAAASIFTDEYNNSLDNPQILEDAFPFIFTPVRHFAFKHKLVGFLQNISYFSADEVSTMFHFPDRTYNRSPLINWLDYKKLPAPHNLKFPKIKTILPEKDKSWVIKNVHRHLWGFPVYKDWVLLGWNEYRNKKTPIYFARWDRSRHHYVIWKSGWGKSVFIWYLARQDLRNGDGLCIIDPHGDLVEDTLSFAQKERAKDIIIFDPADTERPMWLNMLEVISKDNEVRKREMDRAAMDATEIFIKIFGDEIFGPRIQHYFRNWCLTLMEDEEDGGTIIDVPRLFTDEAFLKFKSSKVKNPMVKSFWDNEYANTWDREKQEMIPYFSSKFGPFVTNTTIRNIIGQPKSAFNVREIMDNQKILLVNLSKGKIGSLNAQLLWLIFVSKINMAAMSRADMLEEDRKDFYLYVDEFQNFATETFWEILSEARKYHLALIMAHQFIAQIWGSGAKKWDKPSIKDAVFGNAWTIQSFKVGADDAEYMAKEYAPVLSEQDIIGVANFTTYVKLNIDNSASRPFDIKTIRDNTYQNRKIADVIKEYSRRKHGRKKKYVDMEIEARLWIMPE